MTKLVSTKEDGQMDRQTKGQTSRNQSTLPMFIGKALKTRFKIYMYFSSMFGYFCHYQIKYFLPLRVEKLCPRLKVTERRRPRSIFCFGFILNFNHLKSKLISNINPQCISNKLSSFFTKYLFTINLVHFHKIFYPMLYERCQ